MSENPAAAPQRKRPPMRRKKKVCIFCANTAEKIDYKDVAKLRKFVSESGKILPRRITGTCTQHQQDVTTAIKRARQMALIAYVED